MRVVCVDGNEQTRNNTVALCREHPAVDEAVGLRDAQEALVWFKANRTDLAMIDVNLSGVDGIELATELRKKYPSLPMIFLAEDVRRAFEAYRVHPQNYLLQPLDAKTLEKEINYYLVGRSLRDISHIEVKTFGNFEITVDGSAIAFKRAKAKELLALLVDKQGAGIPRSQAFTEMWEDREYDRRAQKYFDNVLSSLVETLKEYEISEILEIKGRLMRIRPELINCDRYRFEARDSGVVDLYQGVYMYGYPWANWNGWGIE